MRFTTRIVLVQLAVAAVVLAVCSGVFAVLAVAQVRAGAEQTALNIARTVASSPDVRADVAFWSADPGTPAAADLADGQLQQTAADVAERTDALFVVITDDHGIRLAHPTAARLGEVVSTPFEQVLAGEEVVDWEVGTLGRSARAKVPVYPPGGGAAVGEVSVGFEEGSVLDDLPAVLGAIGIAAGAAVAVSAAAAAVLRRRWERVTLGLQPEELVALVQHQSAVLDGVGDGVVALDEHGVVRVASAAASRLLGIADAVGRRWSDLGLPGAVVASTDAGLPLASAMVGGRVVSLDVQPVRHEGRTLGDVIVVRDLTDVTELSEQLSSVSAATGAMRVQRHEFANRLHVAAGLIDADRVPDARAFLDDLMDRGTMPPTVEGIESVDDAFVQALLTAKAAEARAQGVTVRVADETLLLGTIHDVEVVAAVLGNLIDNAVAAAAPSGWVEVALLGDGADLIVTVADSGPGIPPGRDVFAPASEPADDRVRGRGIGLPLSRELAARRGGDVWVIDPGGPAGGAADGAAAGAADGAAAGREGDADAAGAVFAARLPDVLRTPDQELPR